MTIPRIIECITHGEQDYLIQKPHSNLKNLRKNQYPIQPDNKLNGQNTMEWLFNGDQNWSVTFYNSVGDTLNIYSNSDGIFIDRSRCGKVEFEETFANIQSAPKKKIQNQSVRLIIAVASVELFCEDGLTTMTSLIFPNEPFNVATTEGIEGTIMIINTSK